MNIEEGAKYLAANARQSGSSIGRIFWFEDDEEIRLIYESSDCPKYTEEQKKETNNKIKPFYYSAFDDCPRSAVIIVHPDDIKTMEPPFRWGNWENALLF